MKVKILLFILLFQSPTEASLPLNGTVSSKYLLTFERFISSLQKWDSTLVKADTSGVVSADACGVGTTTNYFYHSDHLGSITYITDEKGKIVESYEYKAYGEPVIKDGKGNILSESAIGNPFMFTGREYDSETGLYFYRARYYDHAIGRFIQEDPIGFQGGDTNLYAYVRNNPVKYRDPDGKMIPPVVYPILIYTIWDAAINSTYTETSTGGILTIPPPILWSTALPGLWGAQITFETKKQGGILYNWQIKFDFLIPARKECKFD